MSGVNKKQRHFDKQANHNPKFCRPLSQSKQLDCKPFRDIVASEAGNGSRLESAKGEQHDYFTRMLLHAGDHKGLGAFDRL